jgi:hypothetical protein
VTFTNTSGADHTVVRCTPAACEGAGGGTGADAFAKSAIAVPPDGSFGFTFSGPGTYVYYCSLHGYALMHGTITVAAAATTTTVLPATAPPPTAAPATKSDALASTGGSVDGIVIVAVVLLAVGIAAVLAGTRRRTRN